MSTDQVREVIGPPRSVGIVQGQGGPNPFDVMWSYDHPVSLSWLSVNFYRNRLVIAHAGLRHFLADQETLFILSEQDIRERPRFATAFCR
jgi:hypothetical protein